MFEITIVAFSFICLSTAVFLNIRQFRKRNLIRAVMLLPATLFLLMINLMLVSFLLDNSSYERLTKEHTIATIDFESMQPQQFKVTLSPAFAEPVTLEINGDQWQLDARILKWKGPAANLGLQPLYVLERISGRYQNIDDEISKPRSIVAISNPETFNYWNLLIKYRDMIPWLDAYYGNAVYLPMQHQAKYMITLGAQGLIARPRNLEASQSVENWIIPITKTK